MTVSKGKICGHLVAGKNDFFFHKFKDYEQKKKTSLKRTLYEAGKDSIVILHVCGMYNLD